MIALDRPVIDHRKHLPYGTSSASPRLNCGGAPWGEEQDEIIFSSKLIDFQGTAIPNGFAMRETNGTATQMGFTVFPLPTRFGLKQSRHSRLLEPSPRPLSALSRDACEPST